MADDYYKVLGVSAGATAVAIRTAFRRLAVNLHPDRAGEQSTRAFQRVVAAYEVLSDPRRRAAYDATRRGAPAPQSRPQSSAGKLPVILRASGPLRSLAASGIVQKRADGVLELTLSRAEADQGGYLVISTSHPNQATHWLTIQPGAVDATPLSSVVKVRGTMCELRLLLRVR